jgi:hypothetical protein
MKIAHLHTGADGQSHFEDLYLPLAPGPGGARFELFSAVQGFALYPGSLVLARLADALVPADTCSSMAGTRCAR